MRRLSVVVLVLIWWSVDSAYDPMGSLAQQFRNDVSEAISVDGIKSILSAVFAYDAMSAMNLFGPPYGTLSGQDQQNFEFFANVTQNNTAVARCYSHCYKKTEPYVLELRSKYLNDVYGQLDGSVFPDYIAPISGRYYNQHFSLKWAKGAAQLCRSGCTDSDWTEVKKVFGGMIKFDKLGV